MAVVLDYTTRIAPAALKAADAVGVCRYLSPLIQSTAWKRIGMAEYQELLAAGVAVYLNWEYDAHDWDGGAARGASHGQQAAAQAHGFGYPAGSVILGSNDYDMTRTGWTGAGRGYCAAFAKAVRDGGYRPGVYAPYDVLTWVRDEGLMDAFWQAGMSAAWSGGRNRNAWPGAHLRQRGHRMVGGVDTDWNEILIPNWGAATATTEEDRMFLATVKGTAEVWLTNGLSGRWVSAQEYPDVLQLHREGTRPLEYGGKVRELAYQSLVGGVVGTRPARLGPDEEVAAIVAAVKALPIELSTEAIQQIIDAPNNRLTEADLPLLTKAAEAAGRKLAGQIADGGAA